MAGEMIEIKATIKNNSDVDVDQIPICLVETALMWMKKKRSSIEVNRVVAFANFPSRVKKRSTGTGSVTLRVPALWPTSNGRSDFIDVNYYLIVVTKPPELGNKPLTKPIVIGQNAFDRESRVSIVIGTVPFKEDELDEAPPPSYAEATQFEEELPMYDEVHVNGYSQSGELVVELDSRRLTLPAVLPEISKSGRSFGSLLGSVFGY